MFAYGFNAMEIMVIGLIALLLFGNRLPQVMRSLGSGVSEFKKGLDDVHKELNKEAPPAEQPKPPAKD